MHSKQLVAPVSHFSQHLQACQLSKCDFPSDVEGWVALKKEEKQCSEYVSKLAGAHAGA
jgi:hypothetical protein